MSAQLDALLASAARLRRIVDGLEPDPLDSPPRLVYGRLDPDHTPTVRGDVDLDELRLAFPGL